MRPATVLIVNRSSAGLRHDRLVLAHALHACAPATFLFQFEPRGYPHRDYRTPLDLSAVAEWMPFDVVFLLEEALANPPLLDRAVARRTVLVPNPEWILPIDAETIRRNPYDMVLLKTRHALELFRGLFPDNTMPLAVVGWTSELGAVEAAEPDWGACLHLGGYSAQKNATALARCWQRHPGLPPITIARAFLADPTAFARPLRSAPNMVHILRPLSAGSARALQRTTGLHVYPSVAEGFGHALNEARALGRVLITTGAAPMSDLVADGETGALIPSRAGAALNLVRGSQVAPDDIAATVARVAALGPARLRRMGAAARAAYETDRAAFRTAVAAVWSALL